MIRDKTKALNSYGNKCTEIPNLHFSNSFFIFVRARTCCFSSLGSALRVRVGPPPDTTFTPPPADRPFPPQGPFLARPSPGKVALCPGNTMAARRHTCLILGPRERRMSEVLSWPCFLLGVLLLLPGDDFVEETVCGGERAGDCGKH